MMAGYQQSGTLLRQVVTQCHRQTVGRVLSDAAIKDTIIGIFGSRSFFSSGNATDAAETAGGVKTGRSSVQYGREKNAYEKDLSALRREWYEEVRAKRAQEKEEKEELVRAQEARKEERARARAERSARMAMELDGQSHKIEEARRQKVERRMENVGREFARQSILATFREKRYVVCGCRLGFVLRMPLMCVFYVYRKDALLDQSRHWIATEAELESRIDAAIENPEPLWISEKVARKT